MAAGLAVREPQNRGLVNWVISVAGLKFLYDLYALARGWVDFGSRAVFIVYAAFLPIAMILLYPRSDEEPIDG